jgi:hypothetical protein
MIAPAHAHRGGREGDAGGCRVLVNSKLGEGIEFWASDIDKLASRRR